MKEKIVSPAGLELRVQKKKWVVAGIELDLIVEKEAKVGERIELSTSCTQNRNHTTRPNYRVGLLTSYNIDTNVHNTQDNTQTQPEQRV